MKYLCYFYKIVNSVDSKVYIGSTKTGLRKRWYTHKRDCRLNKQADVYKHMREIGIDKFEIIEVKRQEVEDRQEQFKLERQLQDETDNKLNMIAAYSSCEEKAERKKNWYRNNPEKTLLSQKKYRKKNREKLISETVIRNRNKCIKDVESERFKCELCDHIFGRNAELQRHFKTKKHKKIEELHNQIEELKIDTDSESNTGSNTDSDSSEQDATT